MKHTRVLILPYGEMETKGRWQYGAHVTYGRIHIISCPECGRIISLHEHRINAIGRVSPHVECDCGFDAPIWLQKFELMDEKV